MPQENQWGNVSGIDDFSITSSDPGEAVKDRYWIMAPLGGSGTRVTFKAPLNAGTSLKLSAGGVTFDGAAGITFTEPAKTFEVKATDVNLAGTDVSLDLQMGNTPSVSKPIGVKIMKRRVVKIQLHKVGNPDLLPSDNPGKEQFRKSLEQFLDGVYQPQVNLTFSVSFGADYTAAWDANGNGVFDFSVGREGREQDGMVDSVAGNNDSNIHVFLMESAHLLANKAVGIGVQSSRCVWLLTSFREGGNEGSTLPLTAAHEVGHVMIGPGHPGALRESPGIAPLPGSDHRQRLMRGSPAKIGENANGDPITGLRLVKGEWDAIEGWLRGEENEGRL